MNTRTCNVCKEELCLTKFSKGRYTCRECRNKKRRELKQRHEPQFSKIKKCSKCGKEKKGSNFSLCKESTDGLRSVCKTCHTFFGKIKKFGIDQDKYEFMLKEQNYGCKICGSKDSNNRNTEMFAIDHCHTTGKIRGLLCDTCNRGIGYLKDNKNILKRAAEYVANEGDI